MTRKARITKEQARLFYRVAVESVMVEMYQAPAGVAKDLVANWWEFLVTTSAYTTGLFMHAEPVHTAADLLAAETIEISLKNREKYRQILRDAEKVALEGGVVESAVEVAQLLTA